MAIGGKEFAIQNDENDLPCLFIELIIGSHDEKVLDKARITAIIDSGSDFTYITKNTIEVLRLRYITNRNIVDFNEHTEETEFYLAEVVIEDIFKEIMVVGVREYGAILGMDIISKLHMLINGPNKTFEIANKADYRL